jgi:uncharacterized protein with NRDE domain
MCLLAIFFRVVDDAPLIVGANREESYQRGGKAPGLLDGPIPAVGGLDPVAGGTWLATNREGVVIAITNRSKTKLPARPRSRGLLARDLLACRTASSAVDLAARSLEGNQYAGCNVFCADLDSAFVIHAADWLRVRPMTPGLHVLTANDLDDASDRRIGHALWWLGQRDYERADQCLAVLQELCGQVGNGDPAMCMRGPTGGTVSSSLLAIRKPLIQSTYLHAQGPPDQTAYENYSHLFKDLTGSPNPRI